MTESPGAQQKEKPTKSRGKPQRERTVQKQLVSARRGEATNELVEDQGPGGILQQRAAVRRVSGGVVPPAPASTESHFGYDFSRVQTHTMTLQTRQVVQPNLTVSAPGDRYEQEADQVADDVMRMQTPSLAPLLGDEGALPTISRIQANDGGPNIVPPDVERRVARMKGGGQALPNAERSFFEERMGYDLSQVRLHTDANAVQTSRALQARAFTIGNDIAFNEGAYQPGTDPGRRLLAHELTHVVQQGAARVQRKPTLGLLGAQAGKSDVLSHLQALGQHTGHDVSLYRQEIAQFRQAHSTEQIVGKQRQLLPLRNGSITQTGDRSAIFRACGDSSAAGEITHETQFSAPDGSANTRTDVGVGEEVQFTAPNAGEWTASAGSPETLGSGTTFDWTASDRAASVEIKLKVGEQESSVTMDVIEPNRITATKKREIAYPAGRQGAGMKLDFNFHPMNVSFGNVETREVSGPATNISGYFEDNYTADALKHNAGDTPTFFAMSQDNKFAAAEDTAAFSGFPAPWSKGGFTWVIPNKFRVNTESGDGKQYTTVTQAFSISGSSGESEVEKGGASVERSP